MRKTPGQRRIGIEFSPTGTARWYLTSGNNKRICQGCWRWGEVRNSAEAFMRLLKDRPMWTIREGTMPTRKAIRECAKAMAKCIRHGWSKTDLDELEKLWWETHLPNGKLMPPGSAAKRAAEAGRENE